MTSYTDSTGAVIAIDDAYSRGRAAAEHAAGELAARCQASFKETGQKARRRVRIGNFMALGGFDAGGPWSIVADYATPADQADVDAFIGTLQ